jgi:hypothetical protein
VVRGWVFLLLLALTAPLLAEPGVAILHDSRKKDQAELITMTRRCLYLLLQKNGLATYQFTLFSADFADRKTAASWKQLYGITPAELPALAFFDRNGNKITLKNVIRRITDPLTASQAAFNCAQAAYPGLVKETQLPTGVALVTIPAGATVKLDGHEAGQTPCGLNVTPGLHILEIKHPHCADYDQTVTVLPGVLMPLQVSLEPLPAQLRVESAGVPLNVTLDDGTTGTTPFVANVTAGPHRLRAQASGHYDVDSEVELAANKLTRITLSPSVTKLRVGWAGATAEGYTKYSTSYGRYRIPFTTTSNVYLDQSLIGHLRERLAKHPRIQLVESGQDCDVALKYEIKADEDAVRGVVRILDRRGAQSNTLVADRGMPFLSFDESGAANKRAQEIGDELTDRVVPFILERIQASSAPPPDQRAPIQLVTEDLQLQ